MRSIFAILSSLFLLSSVFVPRITTHEVLANEEQRKEELEAQIREYQEKIKVLSEKALTLTNQVQQFDAQIRITELKINQTEQQVELLTGRITQLSASLEDLLEAFRSRALETYKMSRVSEGTLALVSSQNLNLALSRYHYLRRIQTADRDLLSRLSKAQDGYASQKDELEALNKVLGVQKEDLDSKKEAKARLLSVTKNDEKKYQQLLASARSEFDAIQAIIAGRGDESEAGHVSEGQKIASLIGWNEWKEGKESSSCNSSAAHLHFIVSKNGQTENPFQHLRSGIDSENCSGSGSCSAGDPFNPSGSWRWPIDPKITFSQGYGRTWAVQNTWVGRIYQFHNGIDINSQSSSSVFAVKAGTLYRGSFSGSAGCRLRYVRVKHDDSDLSTFYLHINY